MNMSNNLKMDIKSLLEQSDGGTITLTKEEMKQLKDMQEKGELSFPDYVSLYLAAKGLVFHRKKLPKDWCGVIFKK